MAGLCCQVEWCDTAHTVPLLIWEVYCLIDVLAVTYALSQGGEVSCRQNKSTSRPRL